MFYSRDTHILWQYMERIITIIDFLIGAGALQGVFLAVLLAAGKKRYGSSNFSLAALMLLLSMSILHGQLMKVLGWGALGEGGILFQPLHYLIGPFAYLYARSCSGYRPRFFDALHFLPFAVLSFPVALVLKSGIIPAMAANLLLWAGAILHISLYLAATAQAVDLHDRAMKDERSSRTGDLRWIKYFLAIVLGIVLLDFILVASIIHRVGLAFLSRFQALGLSLAIYSLGFRALLRPPAILVAEAGQIPSSPFKVGLKNAGAKYERSGISGMEIEQIARELKALFERDKPYLDPELSLQSLSDLSGIARNQISQTLNDNLGKNFYDFVNSYRIEEFKRLVVAGERKKDSLLSLALDSGFNSKPAFNAAFKKSCGLTPSQFRDAART